MSLLVVELFALLLISSPHFPIINSFLMIEGSHRHDRAGERTEDLCHESFSKGLRQGTPMYETEGANHALLVENGMTKDGSAEVVFVSKYTEYGGQSGNCQWLDVEDEPDSGGADIPFQCKGYGGYYIYTYFSAFSAHILVQHTDRNYDQYLTEQKIEFIYENRKIEWRFADGKPFCIIIRVKKYNEDSDKRHSQYERNTNSGEELIVRGLQNFERISYNIDTKKTKNANLKARELADEGYREMARAKATGM